MAIDETRAAELRLECLKLASGHVGSQLADDGFRYKPAEEILARAKAYEGFVLAIAANPES